VERSTEVSGDAYMIDDSALIDTSPKLNWARIKRNVSIGVAGAGASSLLKLCQALLLTKFLRIDDYGRLLIVVNLFVFFDSFIGLRVSDVVFRFFQPLKEAGDARGVRNLLLLCVAICLFSGLVIYFSILASSKWLTATVYSDPQLAALFSIYGLTVLISTFSGVYEPILRLHDRFTSVALPQVLGTLVTLVITIGYLGWLSGSQYDLRIIVLAFVIGSLVQTIPALFAAALLVRPYFRAFPIPQSSVFQRSDLLKCLFNSNLSGYLKFALYPGDIFLLGIFASPTQVALYGLARQLTAPLGILQMIIQTAITPEIMLLRAKNRFNEIRQFVTRYVLSAMLAGGVLLLLGLLTGRLVFAFLFAPQYLTALPVFYCLITSSCFLFVLLVFRPLAVSLDLLKWHNLASLVSCLILAGLIITRRLDALTMSAVQLGEAALLRPMFSAVVWYKLRKQAD
jgi:O-antigen/teichoic acid export membrane protein